MKQKVLYTCEICHTDYSSKADAKQCEREHVAVVGVEDVRIHAHIQYPHKILVRFKDGKTNWYRL